MNSRWQRAQEYERGFWESQATRIASGSVSQFEWYGWRAEQLMLKLRALGLDIFSNGQARVVEVGSGPIGVAAFLPGAERVAVDPLEPFYSRNPVLTALRPAEVQYRAGSGEKLPCETGRYDLAIIENCIDHVQSPSAVRAELYRVLKPEGILYLTVNCRTPWGYGVHRVLSRLRLDPGHPHTFTPPRACRFLERGQFTILSHEEASYGDAWRADIRGSEVKGRIKALLGVSEFLFSAISQRGTPSAGAGT
jgi:SAM-dependent methyltransferase